MKNILIGPAGWHYEDWQGIVYPKRRTSAFSELAFIADYFSTVEINSSFYRIPRISSVQNWLQQVKKHPTFKFTIKLWQGFTHELLDDVSREAASFNVILQSLADQQRLGSLLVQFPWRFKYDHNNLGQVERIHEWFSTFPVAVEFRHSSWSNSDVIDTFHTIGLGWVNIDQPVISASMTPGVISTSGTGYVRLHGRNYEHWFHENSGRNARYDYLYQSEELSEWIERIHQISQKTDNVFVIFNNHFRGQAVVNGLQLLAALSDVPISFPASLAPFYPHLSDIGHFESDGQTLSLF